ncbi:hypothetical protein [Pedobacter sp. ASV28]|uniref:hypothetical protein n=1 Tax=Pedobacter sp. ASV28 TaxID=2795123 RepID=UPI0018EC68D8|nr:hypothetical protein [Pedobacter sp. ASV28]
MAISLLESIKNTLQKTKVEKLAKIAIQQQIKVKDIIDLTFDADEQIGFRAAWILEHIYTYNPLKFVPYTTYFLDRFSSQDNLSARRHFAKIAALLTKKNALPEIRALIQAYHTDIVVDAVFSWLIDENVPVAIKSHALNILANLSIKHSWIKDELIQTMDYLLDKESIAFFAKVKQIRKQLRQK